MTVFDVSPRTADLHATHVRCLRSLPMDGGSAPQLIAHMPQAAVQQQGAAAGSGKPVSAMAALAALYAMEDAASSSGGSPRCGLGCLSDLGSSAQCDSHQTRHN